MKRLARLNVGIMIALLIAAYVAYSLLLQGNFLHASIGDIINHSEQMNNHERIVVLAVLPVYISTIIFGSAVLGVYLGSIAQKLILKKDVKNLYRLKTHFKL